MMGIYLKKESPVMCTGYSPPEDTGNYVNVADKEPSSVHSEKPSYLTFYVGHETLS